MKKLIIMIGPPLSGKSTWAKKYQDKYGGTIISRDTEREKLFGAYRQGTSAEEKVITQLIDLKLNRLVGKIDVIVDNTHCKESYLKAYNKFQFKHDVEICYKIMDKLPLQELIMRNIEREEKTGKFIPEHVIENMVKSLDEIDLNKYNPKI